jgi:tRNA(fMet)-specific endonuclease VapC
MVILDTDHVSLLERAGSLEGGRVRTKLEPIPDAQKATTIISYEEQTRGWFGVLSRARSMVHQIEAYRKLNRQLKNFCKMIVLEFDERAAIEFQSLQKSRLHIGTMDLKIAAIALSLDATLVTRNLVDFRKVPGLKVEDWTV